MIRLDVTYAQTRSLALDVKIMLKTLPARATQVIETRRNGRESVPAPR